MSKNSIQLVKRIHKEILESHADAFCESVDRVLSSVNSEVRLIDEDLAILSWHDLEDSETRDRPFQKLFLKKHLLKAASRGDIDEEDFFKIADAFVGLGQWMQSFEFAGGQE